MASCGFTLLPCPNKCHGGGDKHITKFLRKELEKHNKECPRRQYECPHCQEAGEYQERTTKHPMKCPLIVLPCPKPGCKQRIARCNLSKHYKECMFVLVPCKYAAIGCKTELLRKDLGVHEGDSQQHLQLAIDTVFQQQIIIREQENKLAHLQSKEMPMKYKFTTFDQHKTANDKIYSPTFYTSPGGYKMCISVHANGDGEGKGKGTCISVYANLMKGENDNHLPWPFTGTVTVELLNQLEDKNHHSKNMTFFPDKVSSKRVVNEERSTSGLGHSCYISHSKLVYNAAKNCQYLKYDCLYFRISVDAKRSSTPWLV